MDNDTNSNSENENNDKSESIDSETVSQLKKVMVTEDTSETSEAEQCRALTLLEKFKNIAGEENTKKLLDEGMLITTQEDLKSLVDDIRIQTNNVMMNLIGGEDIYKKISENKAYVIDADQFVTMKNNIQQSSLMLEQSSRTISDLQGNLKEQRKLLKKFYQLEAATLANKQGLESVLECIDTNTGWPTIEVYTEHGWVRGSVNYKLHNAIMLAKAATQSDNLLVIEKHLGGLNNVIKQLNQDILDIQKVSKITFTRCKNCGRLKTARQACEHCGTLEVEVNNSASGDDDDD